MAITPWLFALLLAIAAIPAFTMHSFLRLAVRANGSAQQKAKRAARRIWWVVAAATIAIALVPGAMHRLAISPVAEFFGVVALAGLIGVRLWDGHETESLTCFVSAIYIVGMLGSAAFAIYPL